ncbi:hypothetical protein BVX99_01590 [bacterium F16]|nr:hypothetical protein BVX99_01590 [bacterium F16]
MSGIEESLKKTNQQHLLQYLQNLAPTQRSTLTTQLETLDWSLIQSLITDYIRSPHHLEPPADVHPAPYFSLTPESETQRDYYDRARNEGNALIAAGAVAAFTVAGGQGSRLGYAGPKGMFPISPIKQKSLFQLFSEKIQFYSNRHKVRIPWYIMTSTSNHNATRTFFEENDFFGMNSDDVMFFQQGELPSFTFDGNLILADEDRLFMSPDGHGGSLRAISRSGALDDMKKRGCRYISYFQVDNPLATVLDPLFIGLHHLEKSDVSSRMIPKRHAGEKMGVFCHVDGKLQIIEYSDLPSELAESRNSEGTLKFIAGSPAIHIFSIDFVAKLSSGECSLPYHLARKKIPYYTPSAGIVDPEEPNGIKLETFVFDALQFANRSIILEADRTTEFAPVKNAEGSDSPATCQHMMMAMHAQWLKKNGIDVPENGEGELLCSIEISPLVAAAKEDLAALTLPDLITPDQKVYIDELSCRPISSG